MSENNVTEEFEKFLITITNIEKQKEFDRKVDRLKKSSSATTVWAVIPGLLGIFGVAHFYLNRPLEGLIILLVGIIPTFLLLGSSMWLLPGFLMGYSNFLGISSSDAITVGYIAWILYIGFFVGNIISARYQYSKYELFIHWKAKKPWNNWGLDSRL